MKGLNKKIVRMEELVEQIGALIVKGKEQEDYAVKTGIDWMVSIAETESLESEPYGTENISVKKPRKGFWGSILNVLFDEPVVIETHTTSVRFKHRFYEPYERQLNEKNVDLGFHVTDLRDLANVDVSEVREALECNSRIHHIFKTLDVVIDWRNIERLYSDADLLLARAKAYVNQLKEHKKIAEEDNLRLVVRPSDLSDLDDATRAIECILASAHKYYVKTRGKENDENND